VWDADRGGQLSKRPGRVEQRGVSGSGPSPVSLSHDNLDYMVVIVLLLHV
jgi:hypothetical protein